MALTFPKNPVVGQIYDYPPFRYQWDGVCWLTVGKGAETVSESIKAHEQRTDAHSIAGITGLQDALQYPKVIPVSTLLTPTTNVTLNPLENRAIEYSTHYEVMGIARFPGATGGNFNPFTFNINASFIPYSSGQMVDGTPAYFDQKNPVVAGTGSNFVVTHKTAYWIMYRLTIFK